MSARGKYVPPHRRRKVPRSVERRRDVRSTGRRKRLQKANVNVDWRRRGNPLKPNVVFVLAEEGLTQGQISTTLLNGVLSDSPYPGQVALLKHYTTVLQNFHTMDPLTQTPQGAETQHKTIKMFLRPDLEQVYESKKTEIKDPQGRNISFDEFKKAFYDRFDMYRVYEEQKLVADAQGNSYIPYYELIDKNLNIRHNTTLSTLFKEGSYSEPYALLQQRLQDFRTCISAPPSAEANPQRVQFYKDEYRKEQGILTEAEEETEKEQVVSTLCSQIQYFVDDHIYINPERVCPMRQSMANKQKIMFDEVFTVNKTIPKTPEDVIDYSKIPRQFAFGFANTLGPYRQCPELFRVGQNTPPEDDNPCGRLVHWSLATNKLFAFCSTHLPMDFPVRFIIPPEMFRIPRYGLPYKTMDIFDGSIYAGMMAVNVYDGRRKPGNRWQVWFYFLFYSITDWLSEGRDKLHHHKTKTLMFDMYRFGYWPGLLVKNQNVTYDEFSIYTRYLKLNLYYCPVYPRILFLSRKNIPEDELPYHDQPDTTVGKLKKTSVRYYANERYRNSYLQHLYLSDPRRPPVPFSQLSQTIPWDQINTAEYIEKHRKQTKPGFIIKQRTGQRSSVQQGGKDEKRTKLVVSAGRDIGENDLPDNFDYYNIFFSYDEEVAGSLYKNFIKIIIRYTYLFYKENKNFTGLKHPGIFSTKVYPYEFVNPQDFISLEYKNVKFIDVVNKNEEKKRILKVKEFLNPAQKPVSIIKYHPFNTAFFYTWEVLQNFRLLQNGQKVLELTNFPRFLEACVYYNHKYGTENDYTMIVPTKYFTKNLSEDIQRKNIDYYVQYLSIKPVFMNSYFTQEFLFEGSNKYDFICSNLFDLYGTEFVPYEEYLNIRTLFYQLVFGLHHLERDGNLVIVTSAITKKFHADVILIGKKFFKETHLYFPQARNLKKESGIQIIYKDFQGIDEKETEVLKRIFSKLYKDDPTGKAFDVKDPSKHAEDFGKILSSELLSPNYDFIREFNFILYSKRISYYNKLINLKELKGDERGKEEKELRREQYINSVVWARKYDLDYYEFDPENFQNQFENLIMQDMYSLHNEISFKFTEASDNNTERTTMSNAFQRLANRIWLKSHLIDTRDFRYWSTIRRKIAFYRPMFKEIDLVKRVQRITGIPTLSQAWLKLFEILVKYPMLPKRGDVVKSFHMCEAPGNFISATEYYVKERTEIKNLDWKAQSLHPSQTDLVALKDHYGFIKKYPNRWLFGPDKTGDITELKNLEYYGTAMKGCKLVTSDCGVAEELKDYEEIATKVAFCQIVGVLNGLDEGANMVLKVFQKDKVGFHVPALFSAFYQAYRSFDKFYVHKSSLNRQSPEFYIIGIGYKPIDKGTVREMMDSIPKFDKSKDFFETYPTSFMFQMEKAMTELAENFVFEIERIIFYFDNYDELGVTNQNQIKKYINKKNDDWLEKVGLI